MSSIFNHRVDIFHPRGWVAAEKKQSLEFQLRGCCELKPHWLRSSSYRPDRSSEDASPSSDMPSDHEEIEGLTIINPSTSDYWGIYPPLLRNDSKREREMWIFFHTEYCGGRCMLAECMYRMSDSRRRLFLSHEEGAGAAMQPPRGGE